MKLIAAPALIAFAMYSPGAMAQSQTPEDVTAYTTITAAIVESSNSSLASRRTTMRVTRFRKMLNEQVLKGDISIPFAEVVGFVCDNRADYWKLKGQSNVLQSLNSSISDLYKDAPKSEDTSIVGRLVSLFRNIYAVVVSKDAKIQAPTVRSYADVCKDDIKQFDTVSHPIPAPHVLVLLPLDGGVTAISTLLDVVEPPIKLALQIARDAQRRKAVRAFFSVANNKKVVIDAAKALKDLLDDENQTHRRMTLGTIVENWAVLGTKRKVADVKGCEEYNTLPPAGRAGVDPFTFTPSYYACFGAIWAEIEKPFEGVLQAAASYDTDADIAVLSKAAADSQKSLTNAISSLQSDESKTDFVKNLGDLLQLAIAVEKATSKESQDKIQAAVKNALGKS